MLIHWQSHQEYLNFLHETKIHLDSSQRTRLHAAYALDHTEFPFHYEERLQQVFRPAALLPSLKDGLIPQDGVTLSGDSTCVHSHASPYGHKVCSCVEKGIPGCPCKRHFSDPDAHWGWDSEFKYEYSHTAPSAATGSPYIFPG